MKLINIQGYNELSILDDCDFDQIEKYKDILTQKFSAVFKNKLDDFDTVYWDFEVDRCNLTLHYNIFMGLSIYSKKMKAASDSENKMIEELNDKLKNWA